MSVLGRLLSFIEASGWQKVRSCVDSEISVLICAIGSQLCAVVSVGDEWRENGGNWLPKVGTGNLALFVGQEGLLIGVSWYCWLLVDGMQV